MDSMDQEDSAALADSDAGDKAALDEMSKQKQAYDDMKAKEASFFLKKAAEEKAAIDMQTKMMMKYLAGKEADEQVSISKATGMQRDDSKPSELEEDANGKDGIEA